MTKINFLNPALSLAKFIHISPLPPVGRARVVIAPTFQMNKRTTFYSTDRPPPRPSPQGKGGVKNLQLSRFTVIAIAALTLRMSPLHAETHYGYHLHSYPINGFNHFIQFQTQVKRTGATAGRFDTYWPGFQSAPKIPFNPNSAKLTPAQYQKYLFERGYGENGVNILPVYSDLHDAAILGLRPIFNFGVIPEWAYQPASNFKTWKSGTNHEFTYHPTPEQIKTLQKNSLANPKLVGEFLADLTIYLSKQPGGMDILKNLGGWEIFNEAGSMYGDGTPLEPGSTTPDEAWPQLPFTDYLAIIDSTNVLVHNAYKSIGLKNGPPVIAPPIGGTYHPAFWQAIANYKPKYTKGLLPIDQIGLHPYGNTVQAWLEPSTSYHKLLEDDAYDVRTNMTYGRILMPTDDLFTWQSLVDRANATSFKDRLYLYATHNNNADQYFNTNTEMGVARTMSRFAQMGYEKINVNFSEWGASSFIGYPNRNDFYTQLNTTFADPFKYGDVPVGQQLTKEMAENTQAETVVQTLGLMRNWDFVNTATIYEMFEKPLPIPVDGDGYQYGLAAAEMNPDGTPNWKPAGQVYNAFLRGKEIHQLHPHGVNIHISSKDGAFDDAQVGFDAHNVILFNDNKPHSITTGAGDDIIFGGAADDFIVGGAGYNRFYGGFGNDIIVAGAENDKLNGGGGDDLLTGGGGKNQFVFSSFAKSGSGFDGNDTITDFKATDVLTIVGGYSFEKIQMRDEVEGGMKGLKIMYASNGASIFLQQFNRTQIRPENFRIFEPTGLVTQE